MLDMRTTEQIRTDGQRAYDFIMRLVWAGDKNPTYCLAETTLVAHVGWQGLFDMIDAGLIHEAGFNFNGIMDYWIR